MSDLDDQLAELIFGLIYHLDKLDPQVELMAVYDVRTLKETVFPSIKQAFKDAGWSPHLSAYHDAFIDGIKKEAGLMTGQEWYERFEKEMANRIEVPHGTIGVVRATVEACLSAAKRASGIEK